MPRESNTSFKATALTGRGFNSNVIPPSPSGDGGRVETCEGLHGSVDAFAGGDGEHCLKLRSKPAA
jgi:hypothetical protein